MTFSHHTRPTRRQTLGGFAAAATLGLRSPAATAQSLPFEGPIKIVSGFSAGGSQDTVARLIGEHIRQKLGRAVVVENRTGAGSRLAAQAIKDGPADGSTILIANIVTMVLIPLQYADVKYDPIADFEPLARTTDFPNVFVTGPATGARDMAGLMAFLKANPAKVSIGIPAAGSIPHMQVVRFARAAGLDPAIVTYRGGTPMVPDLLSGSLAVGTSAPLDFLELHRAGQLQIVAVTGNERLAVMSDVPTFAELGFKGLEDYGWIGFFIKAGTPAAITARYEAVILDAIRTPAVRDKLVDQGFVMRDYGSARFKAALADDLKNWAGIVKEANLKLQ